MPLGILLGALIAYALIIFFLTWLTPDSALLVESQEPASGRIARLLNPAFRLVRALAIRLAPTRP